MDLGRSSIKLFFMQGGRALLLFLGIIYFARELGAAELGVLFLFQALQGLLMVPADLGIRGALEKRLSEGTSQERILGSALVLKVGLLVIVSVCILLARPYLNQYLGADLTYLLVVSVILFDLTEFFVYGLRGELRVEETAPIMLSQRLIWIVVGGALVWFGFGVFGIVYAMLLAGTITTVWGFRKMDTSIGRPTLEQTQSLIDYSKYHAIASIGGSVYQWIDLAVIGLLLTTVYVSAYEVAWQVTLLVLLVSKSIGWSIFPQISRWDVERATDKIETTISRAIGFALFVSIPAFVGGSLFAPEILGLLFGTEYVIATTVLVLLFLEKIVQSVNDIVESSVRALDRPDMAAKATVIAVVLNIVLNPILVLTVGFVGAAIATAFSWLVNTALHTYYLRQLVSFEFPTQMIGWYVVSSLVMGVVLLGLRSVVEVTNVPTLFVLVAVGVAVYGLTAATVPSIRKQIIVPAVRVFT